jgi:hypothetical protein
MEDWSSPAGRSSILGVNLRMNELTGAFALGQLGKPDRIPAVLHEKKGKLKNVLRAAGVPGMTFRMINDENGCRTLLVVIFDDPACAQRIARAGSAAVCVCCRGQTTS